MNVDRRATVRDLIQEAKKRTVFLFICVVGLSYLMSLTSSSVLFNLPAAGVLIIIARYFSLDFEMRRRKAVYTSKTSSENSQTWNKPHECRTTAKASEWRRKVGSPVVENTIEGFTRHIVSEWLTDLWYSRLTPDKEGPEELVQMMNSVIGEVCFRAKGVNLTNLFTRDIVNLICTHLELFRSTQAKIKTEHLELFAIDQRDAELKLVLAEENKLHPALFSSEAEHKVLQHLVDCFISFTFKPDDLQCSFFRFTARELLVCAVIRPTLNLFTPRFINERIELFVISKSNNSKSVQVPRETCHPNMAIPPKISSNHFSPINDPSITGVELVQLKNGQSKGSGNDLLGNGKDGPPSSKDPLLSVDTRSIHSWTSLPSDSPKSENGNTTKQCHSSGEWDDMLNVMISSAKTEALHPDNSEIMRVNGQSRKEILIKRDPESHAHGLSTKNQRPTSRIDHVSILRTPFQCNIPSRKSCICSNNSSRISGVNGSNEPDLLCFVDGESRSSESSSSGSLSEEEVGSAVTGLDSPSIKVWAARKNINESVAHIRHPLESYHSYTRKEAKDKFNVCQPTHSNLRKRSRRSSQQATIWKEVERTSFLSGDGQDILHSLKAPTVAVDSNGDSELESWGRIHSGISASSSTPISFYQHQGPSATSQHHSFLSASFLPLKCEVSGANIVKSGSKTFAVYAISVMDVNNNTWSIKRRFRHFEELHRRLKLLHDYNHHLPPKHFLSTGLDIPIILERCKLLDGYLKSLLQLPHVSSSIELWDFLSVDSQTYTFSNSLSVVETLSKMPKNVPNSAAHIVKSPHYDKPSGSVEYNSPAQHESLTSATKTDFKSSVSSATLDRNDESTNDWQNSTDSARTQHMRSGIAVSDSQSVPGVCHPTPPIEWVPPNLSAPILDMVDVFLQVKDGGWIRRQVFWVAKQVLQLGMGDAFDDWLIEKIQLLRKGSVIASAIKRVEQILWPDGIFITKHPGRQAKMEHEKKNGCSPEELQSQEADRRAKFVYKLMTEKAPAAIVGLMGRKEYEQCAKDLYCFLQSSVCLKQLAYDLVELLLLSAFPELDEVLQDIHNNRQQYGEVKIDAFNSNSPKGL